MAKVLIVEDEDVVSVLYQRLLKLRNFEVIAAANGEDGLRMALEDKPDIVLLDIMLPGMDGIEVLRRIKKNEDTKNLPVVMLTNIDDDIALGTAMGLGAADYLVKSDFTPQEVIERIQKYLPQPAA